MKLLKTNKLPTTNVYSYRRRFACNVEGSMYWETCRDLMHPYLLNKNSFFFRTFNYADCSRRIEIVRKLEKKLGIRCKSKFYKTKNKNQYYVELSKWWSFNSLRKSVFTAVLKNPNRYFKKGKHKKLFQMFQSGYNKEGRNYYVNYGVLRNVHLRSKQDDLKDIVCK